MFCRDTSRLDDEIGHASRERAPRVSREREPHLAGCNAEHDELAGASLLSPLVAVLVDTRVEKRPPPLMDFLNWNGSWSSKLDMSDSCFFNEVFLKATCMFGSTPVTATISSPDPSKVSFLLSRQVANVFKTFSAVSFMPVPVPPSMLRFPAGRIARRFVRIFSCAFHVLVGRHNLDRDTSIFLWTALLVVYLFVNLCCGSSRFDFLVCSFFNFHEIIFHERVIKFPIRRGR